MLLAVSTGTSFFTVCIDSGTIEALSETRLTKICPGDTRCYYQPISILSTFGVNNLQPVSVQILPLFWTFKV